MTPEATDPGSTQRAIDDAQRTLDLHDGKADGAIDQKERQTPTPEDCEKLTKAYIGRVNEFQGRIADVRRTVDVAKNARGEWQALERACNHAERGLLECLAKVGPQEMHATVDAFDAEVAALTEDLLVATNQRVEGAKAGEQAETTPRPLDSLRKAREVVRDKSAALQVQIDELNGKVFVLMQRIVDDTKGLHYGWRDTFEDFLKLNARTASSGFASDVVDRMLPDRFAIADKSIQDLVDQIKGVRKEVIKLANQKQMLDGTATTLEISLGAGAGMEAREAGRSEEYDRRMAHLLEQHGEDLNGVDPSLAMRAMESAQRLKEQNKLTPFEEALLFKNPQSPDALRIAVEQKLSESSAIDVLDQVRAKQTFRAGNFEKFSPRYAEYNGHDASSSIRSGNRTKLTYTNGKVLDVIVTTQAQRILQNLPAGKEPVLLRPISSMRLVQEGSGRGARPVLKNAPADFIVQHTDIGFLDGSGNIVRDDGVTPVDLSRDEHRKTIEAQIRNQKGFRMEGYKPKLPLRTIDNKPYPYGLYTIKTQSGLSVEGVTVAENAIDFVNADPPEGQTLVLKRIPRPIDLRAPDSEQYGRGSRQFQKVLGTDMVRKEDLAYANVDGDNLTTRTLPKNREDLQKPPDPKDLSTESVRISEKKQEETTRDIQRVLDRNPAIRGVKQVASTVQQTVGHLQKFLEAGQIGSARDSFVKFAQDEATPTLKMLENPQLRNDVDEAKKALRALKGVNGVALGGLEEQIDAQLKALDSFTTMLTDGRTLNLLKTITDESKFAADTWENFITNELPVIVASIVVACAAAALIVATMGGAAPLVAVSAGTLFFSTAGATALGGIVGAELGKEAVYQGRQIFDKSVRSGETTFTERSLPGKYLEGQRKFNEATGQDEDLELFADVVNPLAKEFAFGFATTLATMGIGNVVGGQLSRILQNSKMIERLTARSDVMKSVVRRLTQLNTHGGSTEQSASLKESILRAIKTLGEEFGDEGQEHLLEQFLNELDVALAASDAVDGKLGFGTVAGVLLAIAKNTKIGKATVSYDVRGKSPQALAARTQAIRAEAEGNGAIVTDLGKGYLSIRHPIEVDGKVLYETVQMVPVMIAENSTSEGASLEQRVQEVAAHARQNIENIRTEISSETDAAKKSDLEKALAKAEKAEKILPKFEDGSVTLQEYLGIRDLSKSLRLSIQDQEVLARRVLENSDVNVNDVIRMDDTVGVARSLDQETEARFTSTSKQELAKDASLGRVIGSLEAALERENPLMGMEEIVSEVQNPLEQTILRELLGDLRGIESEVLTERERAVIFRESMEYLHDYQAAIAAGSFTKANPNAHDVFKLLQDNQRKLAHQTIVDRKFLTGSDHGVLHVIEADMRGAMVMADQLGGVLTPEARVLLHQATIDHDMGYTLNTLDTTNNYFSQTKDHPLYSGVRTTDTWAQSLEQHFGPRVRDIYHTAVLDHSDVGKQTLQELVQEIRSLDASDPQDEDNHLALQGKLIRKILALADCSGTTADIKMSKLFMEPDLVGQIGQLKDLDDVRQPLRKQLESLRSDASEKDREAIHDQIAAIDRIAYEIHQQMMEMVAERYTENGQVVEPGLSYIRALEKNFNPTDPGFAVNRDFGSHAASFEGLKLVDDRPNLTYGVNDNFPIILQRLGKKTAVSALTKAMDDFGLDLGKKLEATVDGKVRAEYSIENFADDLTNVYAGNEKSLVIETPQGRFEFVKTASARSLELAKAVNRTLQREAAVHSAIEILENPEKTHDERVLVLSDLSRHFDDSYVVQGKPAIDLIIAACTKLTSALTPQEQQEVAQTIADIMRTVKYQGRGVLRKPTQSPAIERKAA